MVRNSPCNAPRDAYLQAQKCVHTGRVSQRDEINKDKGSRAGESTGRDNVQLYLGIMSGYVSYDLHGARETKRWNRPR